MTLHQDWFTALELGHVIQYLAKGNARMVDALHGDPKAVIYESDLWKQLRARTQAPETDIRSNVVDITRASVLNISIHCEHMIYVCVCVCLLFHKCS